MLISRTVYGNSSYKGLKTENERFLELKKLIVRSPNARRESFTGWNFSLFRPKFAKAFDVTFADKNGIQNHVWATSWGFN